MSAARFVAWLPPWLPDARTRPFRVSCKGGAVGRRRGAAWREVTVRTTPCSRRREDGAPRGSRARWRSLRPPPSRSASWKHSGFWSRRRTRCQRPSGWHPLLDRVTEPAEPRAAGLVTFDLLRSHQRDERTREAAPTGGVVMRRLAAPIVLTFSLSFVGAGHAAEEPQVTLEATLDAAQEVPTPSGTLPGAGGTATFEYDETDKSIAYVVTVMNLTGPPIAAHIHQAGPGVEGQVRITLDQNQLAGGAPALPVPDDLVEPLFDGGTYVNVHTPMNPNGEIRGQIHLKATACSCTGSASALRQCVRQ